MQVERQIPAGVSTPDQAVDANAYIAELGKRGIKISRSEE
jgi:hypothetical protein